MQDFKCPICGGSTKKIWENSTKTRYGMRCTKGHTKTGGKAAGVSREYTTFLVSSEELVK